MNTQHTASSFSHRSRQSSLMETLEDRRLFASTFQHEFPTGFGTNVVTADVATDPSSGAIFVTGRFQGTVDINPGAKTKSIQAKTGSDIFVARFTSGGKLKWVKTFDSGASDGAVAIDVGPKGIAVVGQGVISSTDNRAFILRYTLKGARKLKAISSAGFDGEVRSVGIDSKNNVYFGGFTETELTFKGVTITADSTSDVAGFLFKVNKAGNVAWHKEQNEDASFNAIAIDADDNAHVAGSFDTAVSETFDLQPGVAGGEIQASASNQNAFVAKLLPGGNMEWGQWLGGGDGFTGASARARGIAVDGNGNVAVTGTFGSKLVADDIEVDASTAQDAFVAKLNADGAFQFAHGFGPGGGSSSNEGTSGRDVAFDSKGNLIVAGIFQSEVDFDPGAGEVIKNGGSARGFLLKLNRQGEFVKFFQPTKGAKTSDLLGVDVNEDDFVTTVGRNNTDNEGLIIQLKKTLRK